MTRVPESFIKEVLSRIDIVDLIDERVKLKKAGNNYVACCPFHDEKTPSFNVSRTKQFYYCFGCGASGDAISFLEAFEKLHFMEAITNLSEKVGMQLPINAQEKAVEDELRPLYAILNEANLFYQQALRHHPLREKAVSYLKNRHMSGAIAKLFEVGLSPSEWDGLLKKFGTSKEKIEILLKAGLIIQHQSGRYYDRFRGRIMFPIKDKKGNVVGFGGRVLDDSKPKYLNSPETPVFHKNQCLYGLYEVLKAPKKWPYALIVEGYMDVIALHQHGIVGAMATLGTSLSEAHLNLLFRYFSDIVFCFDGDKAGIDAAFKALNVVLPLMEDGRQVRFVFLPPGEDPDTFIQTQGRVTFESLVEAGTPLSTYLFSALASKVPPNTIDARARYVQMAKPLLSLLPQGVFREMMFDKLAEIIEINRDVVAGKAVFRNHSFQGRREHRLKSPPMPRPLAPALSAFVLLLNHPQLISHVNSPQAHSNLAGIQATGVRDLLVAIKLVQTHVDATLSYLIPLLKQEGVDCQVLENSQAWLTLIPREGVEAEFLGALQRLLEIGRRQLAEGLLKKARVEELTADEKQKLKQILSARESIDFFGI